MHRTIRLTLVALATVAAVAACTNPLSPTGTPSSDYINPNV